MRPPGTYKLAGRMRSDSAYVDSLDHVLGRGQKIIESLRTEIVAGRGELEQRLRIRQIFRTPREIYRIEFEVPEMSYQRTTILDRDALEDLLETDEVRDLLAVADPFEG